MDDFFPELQAARPEKRERPSRRYMTDRYVDYSYDDETSASDPNGRWVGGCDFYERTYRCRVPRSMLEKAQASGNFDKLNDWLDNNQENEIYY